MSKTKKIIVFILMFIFIVPMFTILSSALSTYNFVYSKPQINNNSCYFEILRSDGSANIFYVMACVDSTVSSNDRITDYDKFSIQFDGSVDSGGSLWVGLNYTQIGSNVEDDLFLSCVIIDQDGSMRLGTSSAGKAGVYVGTNYVSIKAYNCLGTFRGGDVVFRYGNDINVTNRLDNIISALQGGNQQVIDNANQNAQQIQQNQNENADKIIANQQQLQENEKNETQNSGEQSVNDVSGAVEDKSAGFISAMGGLVNAMSYNGTNCSWSFPALKIPAIAGLMPEYNLTTEQPINFEYWVNCIPPDILLLIRSVLTIGLIVFCFKELYSTISYVLTLKGGGNNE